MRDPAEAEARLAAFWREDGLADHEPVFALAVMERLAKRRLRANLIGLAFVAALAAVVLGALAPWLAGLFGRAASWGAAFAPAAVVLVVVVSVLAIAGAPFGRALGRLGEASEA